MEETFRVQDDFLVRAVVPDRGKPYEHRCPLDAFESVAHAIDELGQERFSLEVLRERTGLPHTQVNVAFAFLKERGSVVPAFGRMHTAAGSIVGGVHLDAMLEYHALREKAPEA